MPNYFINYKNTLDVNGNNIIFMEGHGDNIFNLHKQQDEDEKVNGHSYKQYDVLLHYMALEYCLNLLFLVLEKTEIQTILESEKELKDKYKFDYIQTQLAHKSIDLDRIYNDVFINYTPIEYED